jgi:hypothetical protein
MPQILNFVEQALLPADFVIASLTFAPLLNLLAEASHLTPQRFFVAPERP